MWVISISQQILEHQLGSIQPGVFYISFIQYGMQSVVFLFFFFLPLYKQFIYSKQQHRQNAI